MNGTRKLIPSPAQRVFSDKSTPPIYSFQSVMTTIQERSMWGREISVAIQDIHKYRRYYVTSYSRSPTVQLLSTYIVTIKSTVSTEYPILHRKEAFLFFSFLSPLSPDQPTVLSDIRRVKEAFYYRPEVCTYNTMRYSSHYNSCMGCTSGHFSYILRVLCTTVRTYSGCKNESP